jgi:hypothetical protein
MSACFPTLYPNLKLLMLTLEVVARAVKDFWAGIGVPVE